MPAHMDHEFSFGGGTGNARRREDKPFNLLVLGNYSGQSADRSEREIASRRIVDIDLDNRDELWSIFSPELSLQMKSGVIEISPRDLDDFHPDQLYRNLAVFADLRNLRKRLRDPEQAREALNEILSSGEIMDGEIQATATQPLTAETTEDSGAMFERLLGKSGESRPAAASGDKNLQSLEKFIKDLVAPHIVRESDPRVETAIDSIDLAIADLMRGILHHDEFQSLEASWRALYDMVSELELDENLHLYVCDISTAELLNALPEPGLGLQESALFQLLVDRRRMASDDTPWSVIVGDFYFGPDAEDIALLTGLGAAAAVNGGIFLAGAKPSILGCTGTAELADARYWSSDGDSSLWQSLRTSAVAGQIGLALPRVLARLPYGEKTEEIDSFQFEEMPQRNHEDYLWSNPAYACARMLAQSFSQSGWDMDPGDTLNLGVLPAHNYTEDGETRLQPCAELLLSESTMVAMLDHGLMPLISYRNQNTAVLGRFQSIASPAAALEGPWGR